MSKSKQVIEETLNHLKITGFVDGFEDSVLYRCCDALNEAGEDGRTFWNLMCAIPKEEARYQFFDGDHSLWNLYLEFSNEACKNGFKMPRWGTRGT